MKPLEIKMAVSAVLVVLAVSALPFVGLTAVAVNDSEGVVIDFGYWNVVWTHTSFDADTDGIEALEIACSMNGYELSFLDEQNSQVVSVDDQQNLLGKKWGMYVVEGGRWISAEDPRSVDASVQKLVCWARSADADEVVPGTDQSGFLYYGYAQDGLSLSTGERLRVVSLAPSITETLVAVGGLDMIVGTDAYSDYPESVAERQRSGTISYVGGFTDPNYEFIVRMNPDLVFCDGSAGEHMVMAASSVSRGSIAWSSTKPLMWKPSMTISG